MAAIPEVHLPELPGVYNTTKLDLDPDNMYLYAHKYLLTAIENAAAGWDTIMRTWADLELAWMGESKKAADEFIAEVDKAQRTMWGSGKDEKEQVPGIVPKLRALAIGAASGYGQAEHGVTDMFREIGAGLVAAGGHGVQQDPNATPPPRTSHLLDPINETFG